MAHTQLAQPEDDTFSQSKVDVSEPTASLIDCRADSSTMDFNKFKVALGKLPVHGTEKAARANSFLPKHAVECDLDAIEKKIIQKLEGTCEVRAPLCCMEALDVYSDIKTVTLIMF